MKIPMESGGKGTNVPLALLLAVVLQLASGVWWVSAKDREHFFLEQRVNGLEANLVRTSDGQTQMMERLARIEERVNAQLDLLDRIEKRLPGSNK
jgi:hypothetical protein